MRERIFFTHSDPHGAAQQHGRFLTGDELDSEDVSEQRASASLPDSVPIESEEERDAREEDEMAALDAVGDYEADCDAGGCASRHCLQDSEGVACMCCCVGVCVCVYARAHDVDMCS